MFYFDVYNVFVVLLCVRFAKQMIGVREYETRTEWIIYY